MFHNSFHFMFLFVLFHFSETSQLPVSLFLMLFCFSFNFVFGGVSVLKQDVICYFSIYYIEKINEKLMFHFFSPNQKQKKKNIFYISSIFAEMRIDVKILHDELKRTSSSCKNHSSFS